jgi:plasmid stabilization system protein ParE
LIRVVYSRRAEEELRAIWRHIATDFDNESAADRILLAIGDKIDLLRDHVRLARDVLISPRVPGCWSRGIF